MWKKILTFDLTGNIFSLDVFVFTVLCIIFDRTILERYAQTLKTDEDARAAD
jgi:hypothetical protein